MEYNEDIHKATIAMLEAHEQVRVALSAHHTDTNLAAYLATKAVVNKYLEAAYMGAPDATGCPDVSSSL